LIDHAWSFRFQEAIDVLSAKPALVERLEKLSEYSEKLDIPSETTAKKTMDAEQSF
jgi:hypothetical protein